MEWMAQSLTVPTMRVSYLDHGIQDCVPSGLLLKHFVWKHTTIPADVFDATLGGILQPVGRAAGDIQFPVGIIRRAVASGFVV